MAYTYDQLVLAYTAAHDGIGPDAATQATFQIQAVQSANGQLTDAQLLGNIVNSADNSTGLAVMAYQFFTGKSPTKAGIDYLVNSSVNTSDLNDAYYSKFNIENRYINFAANLGVQGEGAANFAAKYGALSFSDYVASIYQTIIGASYATAAGIDPAKAIADIISRKDAILATATSAGMIPANATAAQIDIALKAATAGYLLGEAIKADVGLYAAATDNFMVAVVQGTATYNTDITISYQPSVGTPSHGTGHVLDNAPAVLPTPAPVVTQPTGPSGPVAHAFVLTGGNDTFTGESLVDTYTGTDATFNGGDILNGAGGNDTLTITGAIFGAYNAPSFSNVSNIETINISNTTAVVADVSTATGVQTLNVTASGVGGNTTQVTAGGATNVNVTVSSAASISVSGGKDLTVAATDYANGGVFIGNATGAITATLTSTDATSGGSITVSGGTSINFTQIQNNPVNTTRVTATVEIDGGGATTSVTVHATAPAIANSVTAGVTPNTVIISDAHGGGGSTLKGTITTIDVDSYSTLNIVDNALSSLTLAHGSGNITLNTANALAVGLKTTTLNLALNALTNGTLSDTGANYTTLNVTTGATGSTLANIVSTALATLNVSGPTNLTLNSTAGATALHTATVTGAATLNATFGGGNDTITLGAGASTIDTGAGTDHIIVTAANAASNSVFSTVTASAGDTLKIAAQGGALAFTGTMSTMTAFNTDFATTLNDAAAGDGHTTSHWAWFQSGGDTYVVLDNSAAATFQSGVDIVVKLVGNTLALNGATITAGDLTLA